MSFAGRFPESQPDEKGATTTKREMEEESPMEKSPESSKKLKSSYVEETQNRKTLENPVEVQPDYDSENYLNEGRSCKLDNTSLQEGNSASKMEATLRKLGQDAKMSLLKWIQPFGESEAFEAFCPSRLDEILKQALELEENLTEQKECLKARLKAVSRTLQISP